jgi:glycosyltransferase involved in cell wall biosynthesis
MRHSVLEVINTSLLSGGAEHLRQLTGPLVSGGWEVTVACTEDGPVADRWRGLGADVVPIDMMRRRVNLDAVMQLRKLLRRLHPCLIHCHGTRAAFLADLARCATRRTPLIYTVHGLSFGKDMSVFGRTFYSSVEKLLCRMADHVIFVSEADAREAVARALPGRTPFSVIPNGVDARRFSPRQESRPPGPPVVATVARLVEQKGVQYLVDAAAIVCRKLPGCQFRIAGDGPLLPALRERARALGIEGNCHFLGAVAEAEELLAAADLFVLPSLWEGLPIALLEAMASGLPVIAADTAGSREIVERTGAGVIVPRRDAGALADAILSLLSDRRMAEEMGIAARRAVMENYAQDVMIRRTLELYERMTALEPDRQ